MEKNREMESGRKTDSEKRGKGGNERKGKGKGVRGRSHWPARRTRRFIDPEQLQLCRIKMRCRDLAAEEGPGRSQPVGECV